MYALQVFLISGSMYCLIRALDRGSIPWALGAGLAAALSLYVQFTSALALITPGIYVLAVRRHDRPAIRTWLVAQVVTAGLFAPWLLVFLGQFHAAAGGLWMRPFEWKHAVNFLALFSGSYLNGPGPRWPSIAVTAVLLGGGLIVLLRGKGIRERAALPALWCVMPVLLLVLVSLRKNMFLPRALLLSPPFVAHPSLDAPACAAQAPPVSVDETVESMLKNAVIIDEKPTNHDEVTLGASRSTTKTRENGTVSLSASPTRASIPKKAASHSA
jgi:4-amino-4-deoxy-L-arabinose transferase-like glycosyltransferase